MKPSWYREKQFTSLAVLPTCKRLSGTKRSRGHCAMHNYALGKGGHWAAGFGSRNRSQSPIAEPDKHCVPRISLLGTFLYLLAHCCILLKSCRKWIYFTRKFRFFVPFGTFHPSILFLTLKLQKSISLVIPNSCRCGFAFPATGPNIALADCGGGQWDEMRSYSHIILGRKGEHPLVLTQLSRGKRIAGVSSRFRCEQWSRTPPCTERCSKQRRIGRR